MELNGGLGRRHAVFDRIFTSKGRRGDQKLLPQDVAQVMVIGSQHSREHPMSIIKRGSSPSWYIQFQMHGKTYIKSAHTTDKKAAHQMEVEWKARLHAERFLGEKQRLTLKAAMLQYIDIKQGTPSHRGMLSKMKVIERLMVVSRYMDELTSHELERFKRTRMAEGVGAQTLKHDLNLIRGAWKYAHRLGYQTGDLTFPSIKMPKTSLRYLSAEEEKRLLLCLDPKRYVKNYPAYEDRREDIRRMMQDGYDLVLLLLDTGARYSEIANIEWSRIDLKERTINLWRPKVQNEAILYMTDRVFEVLTRRAAENTGTYVFVNKAGGPRGYQARGIRKALKNAGLDGVKVHTLRHTHASRLIQNGMSVYEVREVLGHSDIKTTMRYAHLEARQVTSKARDVINKLNLSL